MQIFQETWNLHLRWVQVQDLRYDQRKWGESRDPALFYEPNSGYYSRSAERVCPAELCELPAVTQL